MSSFQAAVREWRKTRAEWAALMTAIRRDAPEAELERLAGEAGATRSEVLELCNLRKRATQPNVLAVAERHAAAQAALAQVLAEIGDLDKKAAIARTRREQDEAEGQLYDLHGKRQSAMLQLAETQSAVNTLSAAKQAGVV